MKRLLVSITLILILSCNSKTIKKVAVEPSEEIITSYRGKNIAIVLDDMKIDEDENYISYKHKYNVLKLINDSLLQKKLDWKVVNETFFEKHKEDLGMEILSKHNAVISRVSRPVGMGWAIGNSAHGEWEETKQDSTSIHSGSSHTTHSGSSHTRRWRPYTSSPFFWYFMLNRRRHSFNNYQGFCTSSATGKSFYGANSSRGSYDYGTRSNFQKSERSSFFSRKSSNNSRWDRLNRSSSRYSGGSNTRSRSGGYGK